MGRFVQELQPRSANRGAVELIEEKVAHETTAYYDEKSLCWNVSLRSSWAHGYVLKTFKRSALMHRQTPHILERFVGCYDGINVFLAEKDQGLLYLNFRMRSKISRFFDKLLIFSRDGAASTFLHTAKKLHFYRKAKKYYCKTCYRVNCK